MVIKKQIHQDVIRQLIDKDVEAKSQSLKLQSVSQSGYGVSWDKSRGEITE